MKLTKKAALYATVPMLGFALLAGSAFAESTSPTSGSGDQKLKTHMDHSKMGNKMEKPEMNEDKMMDNAIGLILAQVKDQLASGKTIDQIISGNTIDKTILKTQMKAKMEIDMKARLDADVASGKITQEQADAILSHKDTKGMKGDKNMKGKGDGMKEDSKKMRDHGMKDKNKMRTPEGDTSTPDKTGTPTGNTQN